MADSWEQIGSAELAEVAALGPEARREHFADHPALRRPELAWQLAVESGRAVRVDLDLAEALAETADWLAQELGDPAACARARRAGAHVLYFRRRFEAAARVYEEALAGFEEIGDELEAAITRSSAIGTLSHLARYEQAMAFADAARRTYEEREDRLHLGRLEVAVGHVLSRQDRFPEALERFERALELFSVGEPVDIATALRNIAVCYQDLNDFQSSLEAYSAAREHCREHGLPLIGLEVEYNIAYIYYLRGEYSRAIHLFEEARQDSRRHGDPHHEALCELDLAEIFLELNLVEDAQHMAERAFVAFDELAMPYDAAKALAYQALVAARRADGDTALELLRRARRYFSRQENRVWVAMVDLYEALVLFAEGRFEESLSRADAASAGFRDSGVPSRRVPCEILRARLAVGLGELEVAGERCAAALELARESGRPLLELQAHVTAGRIAEAAGDRSAALAAYRRAHEALELLRGGLLTDELKIAFTDDKQAVYEGLVAVTLASGRHPGTVETAFAYVETAKSRGLSDLLVLGSPGTGAPAAEDDPLAAEIRTLRQELNLHYRQIGAEELRGREASLERLDHLRDEARVRERRLLRTVRRLQAADGQLSLLLGPTVTDLETLRAALPRDSTLIEYFIARDVLYSFRLDGDGLELRQVGEIARLRELHRQLRFQFGKFHVGRKYLEDFEETFQAQALSLLGRLRDVLLGDWRPAEGIRHLIVAPHDFLHQVPFHALHDGERYLIDQVSVSYAPSATVFQLCSLRKSVDSERSLVLGVPDERAPRILDEVQAVAEILPDCRLLVGEEATRENLSRLGNHCRFLHLATHGLYRRDNPMFSALQLGDTRMSLLDLYDLELEVDLAVLSGCGTGLSDVQGSDELVGLTRGLLFAGARSVMATLWDVNDDSTAEFMRHFYGRLTVRPEPARALQHAMQTLRQTHPHPYYWAPFVLTGTP